MDKKVKTIQQLQTLQELFPLHIISAIADDHGWVANTTIIFDISCEDLPDYDHINLYTKAHHLVVDLLYNIDLLDPHRIIDTSTYNFDFQHDILDGIFQAIHILNVSSDSGLLSPKDYDDLDYSIDQVTKFLQICSNMDEEQDFLFARLLNEISNGFWRSNVYFDKY